MTRSRRCAAPARRGNATLIALVAVTVLGGVSTGILALTVSANHEVETSSEQIRAMMAAEAAVANTIQQLSAVPEDTLEAQPRGVGSGVGAEDPPVEPEPVQGAFLDGASGGVPAVVAAPLRVPVLAAALAAPFVGKGKKKKKGRSGSGQSKPSAELKVDLEAVCELGEIEAPMVLEGGDYWSEVFDTGDGFLTIIATGRAGDTLRSVEVIVQQRSSPVFDNALFAGNSSGDVGYTLDLGGTGAQGDLITGSVYSGGNLDIVDDATVTGPLRAAGTINGGGGGTEGFKQHSPDLDAMDYANTADVKVAQAFAAPEATYVWDNAGGTAWQLPEENPAHIFRKNPTDRSTDTSATQKDDYFLEDPYEAVRSDSNADGSNAYRISVSGHGGEPGPDSNEKVYFVDGNLWLHNKRTFSMEMATGGDGTRVTFVVSGNIYFSDNLFYEDDQKDGVAFIALKDPNVADSGNIYFGDPTFGTLEYMAAFMYAENNFYDNNLDAAGSAKVTVAGNMSAGNHVLINRDFGDQHSKLTVEFDDRISSGALQLAGIPRTSPTEMGYEIVSWREVSPEE